MKKLGIVFALICFAFLNTQAQENDTTNKKVVAEKKVVIKANEKPKPLFYINGKQYDYEIMELIDPSKIASVSVFKGEQAMKKYNAESVIAIETKKNPETKEIVITGTKEYNANGKLYVGMDSDKEEAEYPVILIDDVVATKEDLRKLNTDDIFSISVLKDEQSKEKYKTKTGVVLVITKEKAKK
ncbi:MAG: hypothetical protein JW729_08015 [Bacteroidales bacterium]|nr:hypothetical protein [Bacteroidales bacterium]